jgi:hypothetical protein
MLNLHHQYLQHLEYQNLDYLRRQHHRRHRLHYQKNLDLQHHYFLVLEFLVHLAYQKVLLWNLHQNRLYHL